MTEEDKRKIAGILEKHGVIVGYIFGSAARGTMGPHSDIDVAVFFDDKKVTEEKQFDEKLKISSEITRVFTVEDADVINLKTARGPLIKYQAIFGGELILEKDRDKRLAVERSVVREYEDTRELRRIRDMVMREELHAGTFGKA